MTQRAGDTRSTSEHEQHLERISRIVSDWRNGIISVASKRGQIADENARYYGTSTRGETGSDITSSPRVMDEVLFSLADRMLVPTEAAGAALAALRDAGRRSAEAGDLEQAKRILAEGRRAYQEILRASR